MAMREWPVARSALDRSYAQVYRTSNIGPRGVVGLARVGMADPVR
jgi:hypothetical protein